MNRISDHITYAEAIHSNTAKRKKIDNTPNPTQIASMATVAEMVFEPFRSPSLNEAIGGVSSSQHCKGQAIDLDDVYGYKSNAEMFMYIRENLDFDQMIWEFGTDMNPNWIHVSYVSKDENRNRCLKAYKEDDKTKYKVI